MYISSKFKYFLNIILINIFISILIIICIDIFFLNRKLPILRNNNYIPELANFTYPSNYYKYREYEFYQVPYGKVGKKVYLIITDKDGCRVGSQKTFYGKKDNLVILGDSYSFGQHADYNKTIAGLLQERLKNFNIWNFSISGTSSFSYGNILKHFLKKKQIRPTILIIGLYVDMKIGDLPRVLARKRFGSYKSFDGYLVGPSLYQSLQHSFLNQALFHTEIFLRSNTSLINIIFPKKKNPEFAISLKPTLSRHNFPLMEDMLLSNIYNVQRISNLNPHHIILWFVPSNHELYHKIKNDHKNDNFYNLSKLFWDKFKIRLQQEGFRVVDPRITIDKLFLEGNIYPFTVDGHLNEQGFKCIFKLIFEEINKCCQ